MPTRTVIWYECGSWAVRLIEKLSLGVSGNKMKK